MTASYYCSILAIRYAAEPHRLDNELWYAHQELVAEAGPKPAPSL